MKKYEEVLKLATTKKPLIIGVIATKTELVNATMNARLTGINLKPLTELASVGAYELRLDKLIGLEKEVEEFLVANAASPDRKEIIVTVRDSSEGGAQLTWSALDRAVLYCKFMSYATFIDIEAATAHDLIDVIKDAQVHGVGVIISFHSLKEFPPSSRISDAARICADIGGCVFKIAIICKANDDHVTLQDVAGMIRREHSFFVAAMATEEPYGRVSRYLDVVNGGPFIYGFIEGEVVSGQPRATAVKNGLTYVL
jgi:3-dehydroquinate dehydratase-1